MGEEKGNKENLGSLGLKLINIGKLPSLRLDYELLKPNQGE